ncbi:GNAT family N-acetyltransferase [Alloactinosynnema sp. L-07]|uniref:GNAT family N-acetyltransferase n=1 Tax=Alloactinosynnema sp. L-07 TaxID=1653480 RepID=UPI0015612CBB|nr:GNAT family N-acetyltransferase [Alloactinosynnema sp. L-07]
MIDRLAPADAEVLSVSHSDPDNARFQGWPSPLSPADALAFIESMGEATFAVGTGIQLAIRESPGGPLVGDLYVARERAEAVELGITLVPGHQSRGLATAAVTAMTNALLAGLPITTVEAICDVDNTRSAALFERAGFRFRERTTASWTRRDGTVTDELRFVRDFPVPGAKGQRPT